MQELSFVDDNTAYIMDKMQKNLWLLDLHARKLAATVDFCSYGSLEAGESVFPCLAFIWSSLFEAISVGSCLNSSFSASIPVSFARNPQGSKPGYGHKRYLQGIMHLPISSRTFCEPCG